MNTYERRTNQVAETHARVQCSKSHWTLARLVLSRDLKTQEIAAGQTCRCGEKLS